MNNLIAVDDPRYRATKFLHQVYAAESSVILALKSNNKVLIKFWTNQGVMFALAALNELEQLLHYPDMQKHVEPVKEMYEYFLKVQLKKQPKAELKPNFFKGFVKGLLK